MLKTSLLSLAAAGLLMTGMTTVPSAPAEAGYYEAGYGGGYGHRRHYRKKRHYSHDCHWEHREVKIRFYDDYCDCYKHKYITKKVKVCH